MGRSPLRVYFGPRLRVYVGTRLCAYRWDAFTHWCVFILRVYNIYFLLFYSFLVLLLSLVLFISCPSIYSDSSYPCRLAYPEGRATPAEGELARRRELRLIYLESWRGGNWARILLVFPLYYCMSLEIFIKCTTTAMGSEKGENCSGALPVGS